MDGKMRRNGSFDFASAPQQPAQSRSRRGAPNPEVPVESNARPTLDSQDRPLTALRLLELLRVVTLCV